MKTFSTRHIIGFSLLSISSFALSHGGGLDSRGGHTNSATGEYHCHRDTCSIGNDPSSEQPMGTSPDCNYPPRLEITVVNIGQGDATIIASPTRILLVDSGEGNWNSHSDADKLVEVFSNTFGENCRTIDYFINSHFHLDHIGYIQADYNQEDQLLNSAGNVLTEGENLSNPQFNGGISYLVNEQIFEVRRSLFRDYLNHNPNRLPSADGSKTYWNWRAYLQSPDGQAAMNPQIATLGTNQVQLGSVGDIPITVDIIQVDAATSSNPAGCDPATYFNGADNTARGDTTGRTLAASENDLSVAFIVSFGEFDMFIGGDTSGFNHTSGFGYSYHDTESCLAEDNHVTSNYGGSLDVLRVNHHGSSHSTNQTFLDVLDPTVSIVSVGDRNRHNHVSDEVIERLLRKSDRKNDGAVYLTEAGIEDNNFDDFCISVLFSEHCAIIGDGEVTGTPEANELGDTNIVISVDLDGEGYSVFGATEESRQHFTSH